MIRFFVSSTFVDMAAERDAINQIILPELRSFVYGHGTEDISMVDLRWGISTEELETDESMKKILSVCMQEIDTCTPHMIILLGDRYGSVPSEEAIRAFLDDAAAGEFAQGDLYGKSVTEMEIIRFLTNLQKRTEPYRDIPIIVCMRNPLPYDQMQAEDHGKFRSRNDEDAEKIRLLRRYLSERFPEHILNYNAQWDRDKRCVTGLNSFVEGLTDKIKSILIKELPAVPPTPEELQALSDSTFEESMMHVSAVRPSYMQMIRGYLDEGRSAILLQGMSGSGKSSLVCQTTAELRSDISHAVVSIHCGNGKHARNCTDVLKHLVWRLELLSGISGHFRQSDHSYEEWNAKAHSLLKDLARGKRVVVMIDGLNMLQQDIHVRRLDFVPEGGIGNCVFILAASDEYRFPESLLMAPDVAVIPVGPVMDDEILPIIEKQLAGRHKQLPQYAIRAVRESAVYRPPLYLSLVLFRLSMLDASDYMQAGNAAGASGADEDALYSYIRKTILEMPGNEEELAWHLFRTAAYKLGFGQVEVFLAITANMQHGFRLRDYAACSKDTPYEMTLLDVTRYVRFVSSMLSVDPEGRVFFAHQVIQGSAVKHADAVFRRCIPDIISYLDRLDDGDPVKIAELLNLYISVGGSGWPDLAIPARYIGRSYVELEQKNLAQVSEREEGGEAVYEAIVQSLHERYLDDPRLQETVFTLLINLVDKAAELSHECLYGFVSAILFSFDALFGSEVNRDLTDRFMDRLHDRCISDIYPHAKDNPYYLRCVYVCCEQCGNRTLSFPKREKYFNDFLKYTFEAAQYKDLPRAFLTEWKHDMAICHGKLADLYVQRSRQKALELYEMAKQYQIAYRGDSIENPEKLLMAEVGIHSINASIANCIIQRALSYVNNGYEPLETLKKTFGQAHGYLTDAIRHLEENGNIPHRYYSLARYWSMLSDYYRVESDPDMLRASIRNQIEFSRKEYEQTRDPFALDLWRNGLFRAALEDDAVFPLEERLECIEQTVGLAFRLEKEFVSNPEMAERIISVSLQAQVDLCSQRIETVKNENLPAAQQHDSLKRICMHLLHSVKTHMRALFMGEAGKKAYKQLRDILDLCSDLRNQCQVRAARILVSNSLNQYPEAKDSAVSAFELGEALMPFMGTAAAFEKQVSISCLCSATCRYLQSFEYFDFARKAHALSVDRDDLMEKEKYYKEMMLFYDKMATIKGEDICTRLQTIVRAIEREEDGIHAAAWMRLCHQCIRQNMMESFWKLCGEKGYALPGQALTYLFLANKKCRFDSDIGGFFPVVGQYMVEHIDDPRVMALLARSDLFETAALEEAYKGGNGDCARIILDNAYDCYLELPLLCVLRKYDRHEYSKRVKELKPLCLSKRKKEVNCFHNLLNPAFCEEFTTLVREIKKSRNNHADS